MAIAKGYAVDKAIDILRENKIQNALINAGGDLKPIRQRSDQLNWKVGLQNPRSSESLLASFSISGNAVATSGDQQKYFKLNCVALSSYSRFQNRIPCHVGFNVCHSYHKKFHGC
jgi:FAD:protein FMN transferase